MRSGTTTATEPRWALVGEPLFREVGDEVFILTRDSQMHWLKNATARFLWERLLAAPSGGCSASELAAALADEFEVDALNALPDIVRFCEHLAHHGLVSAVEPAGTPGQATVPGARQAADGEGGGGPGRG